MQAIPKKFSEVILRETARQKNQVNRSKLCGTIPPSTQDAAPKGRPGSHVKEPSMSVFSLPISAVSSTNGPASALGSLFSQAPAAASPDNAPSFAQMLENAFGQVNGLQNTAAKKAQDFARGKTSDVHSVMIAGEQATLALQLTTQIRNKAVDAYQEVMRVSM